MTGEFDRPDRFGCGGIAMMLYLILALIAGVLAWLMFNALGWLGTGPGPGGGNPAGGGGGGGDPGGGNAVTYVGSGVTGLPIISARDITSGNAQVSTSGAFSLGSTIGPVGGQSDGVDAAWYYGTYPAGDSISLGFSRADGSEGLGLNVTSGDLIATYFGEGCEWEVDVSSSSISGHIACTDIPVTNQVTGAAVGMVDIELDFTANSAGGGEPGGGEETPPGD